MFDTKKIEDIQTNVGIETYFGDGIPTGGSQDELNQVFCDSLVLQSLELFAQSMTEHKAVKLESEYQYQNEEDQSSFLIRTFVYNRDLGVSKMFWSGIVERREFVDAKFTAMWLVYDGLNGDPAPQKSRKLSFNSYKMLADNTDTDVAVYAGKMDIHNEENGLYGYKYEDKTTGAYLYILWSESGEQSVTFRVDTLGVHITDMITQKEYDELTYSGEVTITLNKNPILVKDLSSITSIEEEADSILQMNFKLEQNYPNPFNSSTTITYHLPIQSNVVLRIYNTRGQAVRTIFNRTKKAGEHSVICNGKDGFGRFLTGGIYFVELITKRFSISMKILFMK